MAAQVQGARASYDATVATYRQTILTAFQQVEDALAQQRILVAQERVQRAAVAAAREAERLSLNQYLVGTVPYTTVVQTQAAALSAEQALLTIRLARLVASANLVKALGGGWRQEDLPPPVPIGGLNQPNPAPPAFPPPAQNTSGTEVSGLLVTAFGDSTRPGGEGFPSPVAARRPDLSSNSRASAAIPFDCDASCHEVGRSSQSEAIMTNSRHPETLSLHAGWRADATTGSVAVPIHQTTSYQFRDTEHASNLFALKELGNIYTRIGNPTVDVLEQRIAALEGGAAALAVGSGQAASAFALQNLAKAGDNVVSSTDLYGGTWNLFAHTLKDQGIEVRFVDPSDPQAFARATDDRTRAYYAETLAQPEARGLPDQGSGRYRPAARHSADRRQHGGADPDAAARPWRGGRRLFRHQVSRRPRHLDRRA